MALTTKFNDGTKGRTNTPKSASDHQAEVDAAAQKRRERDIADLAAESAGMENGRIKRFRPGTEAALRAEQARQGTDGRLTAAATAVLTAEAWDRQLVTVGGVTMTNAERQSARKRILDNPDQYFQWARQQGLVSGKDQWDQTLTDIRRLHEIDQIARANGGNLPQALKDERDGINARSGAVIEPLTAQSYKKRGPALSAPIEQIGATDMTDEASAAPQGDGPATSHHADEEAESPVPPAAGDRDFPSAPVLAQAWAVAQAATVPLERRPEQVPAPADPTMASSGLNF